MCWQSNFKFSQAQMLSIFSATNCPTDCVCSRQKGGVECSFQVDCGGLPTVFGCGVLVVAVN